MKPNKKKIEIETKEVESPQELEIAKITFTFGMSKDEAEAILNKPKGQIARNMRKYMNSLIEHAAKKFFENKGWEVKDECHAEKVKREKIIR